MSLTNTTPIPNWVLDKALKKLSETELKILLVIIRSTLGWYDPKTKKRKSRDWLSNAQLSERSGLSERSITIGIKSLLEKQLIDVTDEVGNLLKTADQRRFARRIFYGLQNQTTENSSLSTAESSFKPHSNTPIIPRNFPSTKEIQKKFSLTPQQKTKLTDKQRYQQILQQEHAKQQERDNWRY
jgi:hypothetical protein